MGKKSKLTIGGFFAGILSGLLGVGGGIIMVPIMISYFNLSQHQAHATSLAVIVPTAIASSIIYGFHGQLDMSVAMNLAIGSIIGAAIGAKTMKKIPAAQLKRMFGVLLVLVGIRMISL
ncbi:MAG: Sulfite exporter TauE/SafE [Firmicutes bacterium]|nr:Sulfite exporter TauE/SafE [Bacillota bacterium]